MGFIDAALKKSIRKEKIEIWGDGTNVRDYIYIDDVCQMLIMLLEYEGEFDTFNLSSNIGTSQKNVIEMIQKLGLEPQVEYLPARSVDAKKIILSNQRIMKIYNRSIIQVNEGIELYYQWLQKKMMSKDISYRTIKW